MSTPDPSTPDPLWAARVLLRVAKANAPSRTEIAEAMALHGLSSAEGLSISQRLILKAIGDKMIAQSQAYLLDIYSAVSGHYGEPLRRNVHHQADDYMETRPLAFQADMRELEREYLIVRSGSGWRLAEGR